MSYQRFSGLGWAALALVICACGSVPLSKAKLNEAQTAMHAAETHGAANDPQAKQTLKQAHDQIAKAQHLAKDGDGDEGNLYLDRAKADAELAAQQASTYAESEKARQAWAKSKTTAAGPMAPQ